MTDLTISLVEEEELEEGAERALDGARCWTRTEFGDASEVSSSMTPEKPAG